MGTRAFTGKILCGPEDLKRLEETHRAFNACALLAQQLGVWGRKPDFWKGVSRSAQRFPVRLKPVQDADAMVLASAMKQLSGGKGGQVHVQFEKLLEGSATDPETARLHTQRLSNLHAAFKAPDPAAMSPMLSAALLHDGKPDEVLRRLAEACARSLAYAESRAARLRARPRRAKRQQGGAPVLTPESVLEVGRKKVREMVQKALERQEAACALVALAAKPLPKDAFGSMPSVLRRIALKVGMGNLRSHMANRKRWSQLREQRLESLADTRAEALRSPYAEELRCIQEFWHDMGIRKTKLRRRARQASYAKFLAERIPPACARHGLPVPPPEAIKKAVQLGARGAYGAILSLCEPLHEADELNYRLRELRRYRKPHALTWIDPDHHPVFASWEGRANGIDDLAVTDSRRRLVAVTLCGPHGRRAPREQRYKLTLSARADRRLVEDPAFQRWASSKPAEGETVSVTLWYRRGFNGRTDFTGPYLRFTVTTPDPATGVGVEAGLDLGQRRHVLAIRREQEGKVSWKPVFLNPRPTDPRRRDAGFGPAGRRAFQRTFRREQSRRRGQQRSPRADAALAKARNYVAKRFAAEIAAKCLEHGVRTLYVEDLSPAAMHTGFRTRQQNANFKEWCLRQTRIFLRNRCAREGIALKEVFPGYTSQVCAQCGAGHLWRYLVRRGPDGQRRPQRDASGPSCVCVECGAEPNPDFNASKNILRRGRREFTTPQPLDEAGKRRIQEAALKRLAAKNAAGQARI